MHYRRKQQLTIILVLAVAIASLSVGFAAFSATLNISSSATITPNSENFSVVFSSIQYAVTTNNNSGTVVSGVGTNGAQGGITNLYQNSATGLIAQFTEPGQALSTTFYIHNTGEYDAYLRGVNISSINGNSYKKCIASSGTTDSLVQSACNGINIVTTINGQNYSFGETISGHKIEKGTSQPIVVVIAYAPDAARADGNFDIEFGDISLEYSTVDSLKKIISFVVDGITYQAEEGMSWQEFISSPYNKDGLFTADVKVEYQDMLLYDESEYIKVQISDIIVSGKSYTTDNS